MPYESIIDEVQLATLFHKISDGSKTIHVSHALGIVYQMGLVPSQEDIEEFAKVTNGLCSLSKLKKFCDKLKLYEDNTDNIIDFFYLHDPNRTGKFSKKKLKNIFTTVGSPLTESEMDIIIRELSNDNGEFIDYEDFLKRLLKQKYNFNQIHRPIGN